MNKTNRLMSRQLNVISGLMILLFGLLALTPCALGATDVHWKQLESKHFVVFYEKAFEGHSILKEAETIYPRITSDFNYYPPKKVLIYAYHNHSLFLSKSPSGITRAYSQPFMNRIVISASQKSIKQAVAHEISHIVFLQSVPNSSRIPFWFVEGIAIYESLPESSAGDDQSYTIQGNISSIADLSVKEPKSVEEQGKTAINGYLVIDCFVSRYGKEAVGVLIKNLQSGMDFDFALENSMGVSLGELDKTWNAYAAARSRQVYIQYLQYFGFWVLGFMVLVSSVIWIRKRTRLQEELKEEIEEEIEEEKSQHFPQA